MLRLIRHTILQLLFIGLWVAMVYWQLKNGNTFIAVVVVLLVVTIFLINVFPQSRLGHFAVTHELALAPLDDETPRQYQLRLAKWWVLGSVALPLGHGVNVIFNGCNEVAFLLSFVGYIFGIACALKLIGCLIRAARL